MTPAEHLLMVTLFATLALGLTHVWCVPATSGARQR
jgi:hypothetical protein